MRPLELRIHGIKSFYSPAVIDFETLSSGGIFGIFGNTGSGKTTVVDSLIFALYGDTCEKSLVLADYINKRLDRAEVRLRFTLTENDGSVRFYEVFRSIGVDRKTGAAKPAKAELWDTTEERVSLAVGARDVTEKITSLIGLDLKEFSNCIILEQNAYDRFVKATDAERKAIVGSLFGLQKYGPQLQEAVKEKESEWKTKLVSLEAELRALGDADEAALEQARKDYNAAQAEANGIRLLLAETKKAADARAAEAANFERMKTLRDEISSLEKESAKLSKEIDKTREKAEIARKEEALRLPEARMEQEQLAVRLERLETNRDIDRTIASLRAKFGPAKKKQEELEERYAADEAAVAPLKESIEVAEQEKQKLIANYMILTSVALPPDDERAMFAAVRDYNAGLEADVKELAEKRERLRLTEEKLGERGRAAEEALRAKNAADADMKRLVADKEELSAMLELAEGELEAAKRENLAASIAASLREGDVCPVCGNRVVECAAKVSQDVARLESDVRSLKRRAQKNEEARTACAGLCAAAERDRAHAERERDKLLKEAEEARLALGALEVSDETERCLEECKALLTVLTENAETAEKARKELTAIEARHGKDAEEIKRWSETASQTAIALDAEVAKREKLLFDTQTVASAIAAAAREKKALDAEIEKLSGKRRAAEEALANGERTLAAVSAKLDTQRKSLAELSSSDFDSKTYAELLARCDMLETEERRAVDEASAAKVRSETLERSVSRAIVLRKEKAVFDEKAKLLERLKKMTGSGKLMEWLAEEYIEAFTELASAKLIDLTSGEMELKYTPKGFVVVDNFNDRAERKVATVSGGETFLVSLALAIAIASKLEERAGARRIEFLFIDEGFGTLSQDKIDAVMDALCNLGGDFTVGFISHVQEMRTRIPRQLAVKREDEDVGSVAALL